MYFINYFIFNSERRKSYYTKLNSLITSRYKFDQACFKIIQPLQKNDIEYKFSISIINQFKSGIRNINLSEFLPSDEKDIFFKLYEFKKIENMILTLITITEIKSSLNKIFFKAFGSILSIFIIPFLFYMFYIFANDISQLISVNKDLFLIANFFYNNIVYIYLFILLLIFLIFYSLNNYNGKFRKNLNYFLVYKIHTLMQGIIFFNTLSGLLKSDIKIIDALKIINTNRDDYISTILTNMINNINNGENFGIALMNTKFPSEKIAVQINTISQTNNFNILLEKINTDIKENIFSEIETILTKIQIISLVLIGLTIILFITSIDTSSLINNMNF